MPRPDVVITRACLVAVVALGLAACQGPAARPVATRSDATSGSSATLYRGGDILTMAGDTPQYVQALVVRDGRIVFAGAEAEGRAQAGEGAATVDLAGRTLLPGFIDGHGHIGHAIEFQRYRFLRTPDVTTVAQLVTALKAHASKIGVEKGEWIVGNGYDPLLLAEKRHPTADELDAIASDRPVLLIHASGHLGVANHAALSLAGYADGVPDPRGGRIARVPGTRIPLGLLEESAFFKVLDRIPGLTREQMATFTDLGMQEVASKGLTTVTESGMTASQLPLLMDAAARRALPVDVVAYAAATVAERLKPLAVAPAQVRVQDVIGDPAVEAGTETAFRAASDYTSGYKGRLRIAGPKLWADGAPVGATSDLSPRWTVRFPGMPGDARGISTDEPLARFVDTWYPSRYQILIHVNGAAAADRVITAVEAAQKAHGMDDKRPVVVHCGLCRDDQTATMKQLGIVPSFSSSTVTETAAADATDVGPDRRYRMPPAGTAARLGMPFTIHNDSPLVPWDVMPLVGAAVTRTLPDAGTVYGPEQRLTPYQALLAVTRHAAYALFEEGTKGTLEAGKRADLVLLERNPTRVVPDAIGGIRVLETIKDGVTIYRAH